jgi:hypothetical protein
MMVMQMTLGQKVKRACEILGLTRVLGGIVFFAMFHNVNALAGQSATLIWSPNTNSNVAGYNVYYGVASGAYTNMINAGNATNTSISGLIAGVTYYFAATAYDSLGGQSGYSDEASYVVPAALSKVQIRGAVAGQFILTVTGPTGQTYNVLATQDFKTWTIIGTVTLDASGSLNFTDTNAASFSKRFYRTQQTP